MRRLRATDEGRHEVARPIPATSPHDQRGLRSVSALSRPRRGFESCWGCKLPRQVERGSWTRAAGQPSTESARAARGRGPRAAAARCRSGATRPCLPWDPMQMDFGWADSRPDDVRARDGVSRHKRGGCVTRRGRLVTSAALFGLLPASRGEWQSPAIASTGTPVSVGSPPLQEYLGTASVLYTLGIPWATPSGRGPGGVCQNGIVRENLWVQSQGRRRSMSEAMRGILREPLGEARP